MLGAARLRAGLRGREAARLLGLDPGYLVRLETGQRVPSATVARRLAEVLVLTEDETAALMGAAVTDAGADHPAKRAAGAGMSASR
jgi:transcriptional regulator with XRE-family HTH domain